MPVDVIIVSFNTRDLTRAALRSLEASELAPERVIVVDNASADGSAEMVASEFPDVTLIRAGENLGFARGNNLGFERSEAPYVLLLNSDAEVAPASIGTLAGVLDADATVGAAGPVLRSPDGSVQFEGGRHDPSITGEFSNITGLNRRARPGRLTHYLMNDWDHLSTREVEVLSGACMLLRRDALGGRLFRTDFFMYGEDIDLCQRVRDNGFRLLYCAEAEVLHHGGASSKQARLKMRVAGVISMAQVLGRRRGRVYAAGYVLMVPVALAVGAIVKRLPARAPAR